MALAPLLQLRRMMRRRSSADVSIGYLLVLLPGFVLWIAYGLARGDLALVVPNSAATLVGLVTLGVAVWLRRSRPSGQEPRPRAFE